MAKSLRYFLGLTLLASLGAGPPAGPGPALVTDRPARAASVNVVIERTVLGSTNVFDRLLDIAISTDANHVAVLGQRDNKQFVVFDGHESPPYDWVIPASLEFSPDRVRMAYVIQTADQTQAVVGGKAEKGHYSIVENRVVWDADGNHYAYGVRYKGGGGAVVVDGVEGPRFDDVQLPVLSDHGGRTAYAARRGKMQFAVTDGKEGALYDIVRNLLFSIDGKHLAFAATRNGKEMLVMDSQEGNPYDSIEIGTGFSANGSRLVAVVTRNKKIIVLVNGRESKPFDLLMVSDFVLSADGRRIGYGVRDGGKQFIIIDDSPYGPYEEVGKGTMTFSPDSKRAAWWAGSKQLDYMIVDGKPQNTYEAILRGGPVFSPDSRHIAYGARLKGKWRMVMDGVDAKAFDMVLPPLFSPDSQHMAYRAAVNGKPVMVSDGVESELAENIGLPAYSPDSRHLLYLRVRGHDAWLTVDGKEVAGPFQPAAQQMRIVFDSNTSAHFLTQHDGVLTKVQVKITPKSANVVAAPASK